MRWTWRTHRPGQRAEALARAWLAAELATPADALALARDARNRPQLHGALARYDCNWSHSGGHLLLALGDGVRVGVDVEQVRPRARALELAQRFFAAEEVDWLRGFAAGAPRDAAFARLWCLKEALLKAHGHGLSFGLHRVAFAPDDGAAAIVRLDPALGAPADWTVRMLDAPPGCVAALAWRPRA